MPSKNIPVICLLFLLSACSGSKYYFDKRIRPDHTGTEMKQVPENNKVVVSKPEEPVAPVQNNFPDEKPGEQGQYKTVLTITKHLPAIAPIREEKKSLVVPSGNQVRVDRQPITETKKSKALHPLAIFFIVLGGILLLSFVVALLSGATVVQALQITLIVLAVLVFLILYTALKSW